MIKGAYTIFNNMNSDEYTEQEKLHSIKDILSLATHNSITKHSIISAFRWMYDYCFEEASKPTTNGDKIRAMTDEKLAQFLGDIHETNDGMELVIEEDNYFDVIFAKELIHDWLKEEVKENE